MFDHLVYNVFQQFDSASGDCEVCRQPEGCRLAPERKVGPLDAGFFVSVILEMFMPSAPSVWCSKCRRGHGKGESCRGEKKIDSPAKKRSGRGGRPWRRLVEAVKLRDKYTCQRCGLITDDGQCDHIVPLERGGTDDPDNLQWLCVECHKIKSVLDQRKKASANPGWLPRPACDVVVVTGPPGGGKSTWCQQRADRDDVIIDLDECVRDVCGVHGHEASKEHLNDALLLRNKRLADLASKADGRAFVIVCAPVQEEVAWWIEMLGATHKLCSPGLDVCLSRLPEARKHLAVEWYRDHQAGVFRRPLARRA